MLRLDILEKLYIEITIPLAVRNELEEKRDLFPNIDLIFHSRFISIREIENKNTYKLLRIDLDNGEAEAITLAIENNAELLLLDEIKIKARFWIHEDLYNRVLKENLEI